MYLGTQIASARPEGIGSGGLKVYGTCICITEVETDRVRVIMFGLIPVQELFGNFGVLLSVLMGVRFRTAHCISEHPSGLSGSHLSTVSSCLFNKLRVGVISAQNVPPFLCATLPGHGKVNKTFGDRRRCPNTRSWVCVKLRKQALPFVWEWFC